MSCPSGATLLLYVEEELDAPELRELEPHLIGCRDCRRDVVALRDESRLLGDVLLERERGARVGVRANVPEPGVAVGLPAAIVAVTTVLAVVGFLIESRVPGGLDHLNPLRLKGAYEMAFDMVFMLRDRAPGLIELAASFGAVAGVSALLTFGVGVLYRRVYGAAALVAFALLGSTAEPARALVVRFDEDTRVSANEVVKESMLLTGERAHIDGVVEGDVVVSAKRVTIGGTVKGSVYVLSRDLEVTGTIEGNLHGLVEDTRIDGEIGGSLYQAGESITLGPNALVKRDFAAVAEDGILGGRVGRDVIFGGDAIELRSEVGRNVDVRWAEKVSLRDGARIAGNLEAGLEDENDLDRAPGATVGGELTIHPRERMHDQFWSDYTDPGFYAMHGLGFVAAFLFGLLLRALVPALFQADLTTTPQFFRSLGYGFLVIVATPIAICAVALTVVGIPVAVLAAFAYIVMLYSAEILVGAWLGRTLTPLADEGMFAFGRSFFVGLAILVVTVHLPFIGIPLMIVATLIGVGLFFEHARSLAMLRT